MQWHRTGKARWVYGVSFAEVTGRALCRFVPDACSNHGVIPADAGIQRSESRNSMDLSDLSRLGGRFRYFWLALSRGSQHSPGLRAVGGETICP